MVCCLLSEWCVATSFYQRAANHVFFCLLFNLRKLLYLITEKERAETQLAQEQHKLERLENRKKYLEKGERTKRTHRLCNLGGTIESLAPELSLIHISHK